MLQISSMLRFEIKRPYVSFPKFRRYRECEILVQGLNKGLWQVAPRFLYMVKEGSMVEEASNDLLYDQRQLVRSNTPLHSYVRLW